MSSTLRIFISSPGDVAEERVLATKLVRRLADEFANQFILEPVIWEAEPLLATSTFQTQIPKPSECHIAVVILWSRLGTRLPPSITRPDGSRYGSGTEYEFEEAVFGFRRAGFPELLVYRKTADALVSLKDRASAIERLKQSEALDSFLQKWFYDNEDGSLKAAFHPFESSAQFEEIIEQHLRKLITRKVPRDRAPPVAKPTVSWKLGSPFRGLQAFEPEHAPIYFGRTRAVGDVIAALRKQASNGHPFVLITGASGGGKSSLARAGVLPLITQPGVIEGVGLWRQAIMRPGEGGSDPIACLSKAILSSDALPELNADETTADVLARAFQSNLASASATICKCLSELAAAFAQANNLIEAPATRLILIVDQLEELFTTPGISRIDRELFAEATATLCRSGSVWVICTARGDFYQRCFELPAFGPLAKDSGHYVLLAPTGPEIAQIIRRPAQAAGLQFEQDPQSGVSLDDVLREAAGSNPQSLPLLEFALDELYQRRGPEGILTVAAYERMGGIEGAIARRAEEVFTSLAPELRSALPLVFRQLVNVNEDHAVRRPADLEVLYRDPSSRLLVEALLEARLLSVDDGHGRARVGLAHEALLVSWPRIADWLQADRELLKVRARISAAAAGWDADGRRPDRLLGRGRPLAEARSVQARMGDALNDGERKFIQSSAARARVISLQRATALLALTALVIVVSLFARRAVLARRIDALSSQIGTEIDAIGWDANGVRKVEAKAISLARLSPARAAELRKRLVQSFASAIDNRLDRGKYTEDDGVVQSLDLIKIMDKDQYDRLFSKFDPITVWKIAPSNTPLDTWFTAPRLAARTDGWKNIGSAATRIESRRTFRGARMDFRVEFTDVPENAGPLPQLALDIPVAGRGGYRFLVLRQIDTSKGFQTAPDGRSDGVFWLLEISRDDRLLRREIFPSPAGRGPFTLEASRQRDDLQFEVKRGAADLVAKVNDGSWTGNESGQLQMVLPPGQSVSNASVTFDRLPAVAPALVEANQFFNRGEYLNARDRFEVAAKRIPGAKSKAEYRLAQCELQLGHQEIARSLLQSLWNRSPKDEWAVRAGGRLWLDALEKGDFNRAWLYRMDLSFARGEKNLPESIDEEVRQDILAKYRGKPTRPNGVDPHTASFRPSNNSHFVLGADRVMRLEQAIEVENLLMGVHVSADQSQYVSLIRAYEQEHRWEQAREKADELMRLPDLYVFSYESASWCYRLCGDSKAAIGAVEAGLKQRSGVQLWVERCRDDWAQNDYVGARRDLEQARRLVPADAVMGYTLYAATNLMDGFLELKQDPTNGERRAQELWSRGTFDQWRQMRKAKRELASEDEIEGEGILYRFIAASLVRRLTDGEIKELMAQADQLVGGDTPLRSIRYPALLGLTATTLSKMWDGPEGRELARRLVFQDESFLEQIHEVALRGATVYISDLAPPSRMSEEYRSVARHACDLLYQQYFDGGIDPSFRDFVSVWLFADPRTTLEVFSGRAEFAAPFAFLRALRYRTRGYPHVADLLHEAVEQAGKLKDARLSSDLARLAREELSAEAAH